MLEDAQSWMNGRKIKEIKDKSGTLNSSVVLFYAILCMQNLQGWCKRAKGFNNKPEIAMHNIMDCTSSY